MNTVPRCIFTVTTGRSGSRYLTDLLARCRGVKSTHEPPPNSVHCLRMVQLHPELAREFLLREKLPAIEKAARGRIYVETSHVFCKGFLEAWLQLPQLPVPDLIELNRDYRKVALSMLSLDTTPARTVRGARWYLSPADATCFTRLPDWTKLHDYQLCYWYCLETDKRKKLYTDWIHELGGRVAVVELNSLNSPAGFEKLRADLDLPPIGLQGQATALLRRNRSVNKKSDRKTRINLDSTLLDEMEQEVRDLLTPNDPARERFDSLRTKVAQLRRTS